MRHFISEQRFRVMIVACLIALVGMLGTIYAMSGFNVVWNAAAGAGG